MSEIVPAHPFRAGIVWCDEHWVSLGSAPEEHARQLASLNVPRVPLPEQWDDSAIAWPRPLMLHTVDDLGEGPQPRGCLKDGQFTPLE